MVPWSTERAPSHSTSVTAENMVMMANAMSQARTRVRRIGRRSEDVTQLVERDAVEEPGILFLHGGDETPGAGKLQGFGAHGGEARFPPGSEQVEIVLEALLEDAPVHRPDVLL